MRDLILDNVKVTLQWRRLRMLVCFLPSSDCIHKSGERERDRETEREREREKESYSVTTQIALKQRLSFTLRAGDGRHVINTK